MAVLQFADSTRNARANAIETDIGTSPILRIRSGALPANCAAADAGTVLAEMTLPSDWMADAASGVKAKAGTWQDLLANAAGTAQHFRIYTSGGVCKAQGDVTAPGGGGAMTLVNTSIALNQPVTIDTFSLTEGNA